MTTNITGDLAIPDPDERAALNAALFADNIEPGCYDDQGRPVSWPTTSTNGHPIPAIPAAANPEPPF